MFKILVAEDDAELRQLFCRVLTRHGFQPIGAADGVEALQVLERDYIDLIVSDIICRSWTAMHWCVACATAAALSPC